MTDTTETETPIRRIVVGTDFSEPSYPALKAAASTARREGATVFLAHVIDPLPHIGPGLDAVMGTDALREGMEEYAKQHLKELRESHFAGLSVETHILYSPNAGMAMTDFAERVNADLIVVGTHGRSGIQRLMLGSVAEKVTRLAPCSVLVVRA
ncbi:MAG: universal stress protein [Sandaracinaceae bacterium]|jgi:nucleotide-binding universal stress UspA family protein|nr:universal stress protein [Sandaracinaceae bacterium]MBK8593476.1 universal stress protein [Sandaracinaceae bacterium]MBP7684883.1 universal stress protein [Deltaproteobacteria bacterium]